MLINMKYIFIMLQIQNYDLKGLPLSFNNQTRQILGMMWISPGYMRNWVPVDLK